MEENTATTIGVTGLTAVTTDVRNGSAGPARLSRHRDRLAFLLLMIVSRSILVPLDRHPGIPALRARDAGGHRCRLPGASVRLLEGQPIVSFMPIFLIGLVFGLAMDYQVFLVDPDPGGPRPWRRPAAPWSTASATARASWPPPRSSCPRFRRLHAGGRADHQVHGLRPCGDSLPRRLRDPDHAHPRADVPDGRQGLVAAGSLDQILPKVDVEGERLQRPHLARWPRAWTTTRSRRTCRAPDGFGVRRDPSYPETCPQWKKMLRRVRSLLDGRELDRRDLSEPRHDSIFARLDHYYRQ